MDCADGVGDQEGFADDGEQDAAGVAHGAFEPVVVGGQGDGEVGEGFKGGITFSAGAGPLGVEFGLRVVVVVLHASEASQRDFRALDAFDGVCGQVSLR